MSVEISDLENELLLYIIKLNIHFLYNLAIPLLEIYTHKHLFTNAYHSDPIDY